MTGETKIFSLKKNCGSVLSCVNVSFGYLNQRGLRTGEPSMLVRWYR